MDVKVSSTRFNCFALSFDFQVAIQGANLKLIVTILNMGIPCRLYDMLLLCYYHVMVCSNWVSSLLFTLLCRIM